LLTGLVAFGACSAHAQDLAAAATDIETTATATDSEGARPAQPLWEVGGFAIAGRQLAYPGSRQRVGVGLALPYFIYRGRVLRADQGVVGLRAFKTERSEVDIGFAGAFGSSASESSARRGMPDIGTLVEFGPRLKLTLGGGFRAALPLRGVFDLSDGFRHRGMAFEPEISWSTRAGAWNLGSSLSWVVGDERLASTFYRVAPEFAIVGRPAYEAQAGLISTRLEFNASRSFGRDWRLFNFVRMESVAGAANRSSPLVESRSGTSFGVGLSWTWLRSEALAQP
jgi:outer membrane scaffolding protein for murein synthesis (MipA/OmpV family)